MTLSKRKGGKEGIINPSMHQHSGGNSKWILVSSRPAKVAEWNSVLNKQSKPGMVAHTFNPYVREAEMGGFLGLAGQPV